MDTAYPTLEHPFRDAFEIAFQVDQAAGRVIACRTVGLADFGFPELLVRPDEPFEPAPPGCPCGCPPPWPEPERHLDDEDDEDDDPEEPDDEAEHRTDDEVSEAYYRHVVRSAQMMSLLAHDVLSEDSLDVLPRSQDLLDLPVRFWLGEPELIRYRPPDGPGFDELAVPVHWVIE